MRVSGLRPGRPRGFRAGGNRGARAAPLESAACFPIFRGGGGGFFREARFLARGLCHGCVTPPPLPYTRRAFSTGGGSMRFVNLLLAFFVLAPATAQDGGRHLELADYLSWEQARSPQIAPDGSLVVYERRFVDSMKDRWNTEIWAMAPDGGNHRMLTEGSGPIFSPDSTRIAFTRPANPGGSQIFVLGLEGSGRESQITRIENPPSQIRWAPDGNSLMFRAVVPPDLDGAWAIAMPKAPEGADWTAPPRIVTRLNYRRDGSGYIPAGFRHLFSVPADGGTPRQLTHGDFHHDGARFLGDGRGIVFTSLRTPDAEHAWRESEIFRLDVSTGRVTALTDRVGPDSGPVPSPDGQYIAYTGMDLTTDTYREEALQVMRADGSEVEVLATEMGRRPGIVGWAADSSGVYFGAQIKGTSNLYFAPLDGEARPVTSGNHMLSVSTEHGLHALLGGAGDLRAPRDGHARPRRLRGPLPPRGRRAAGGPRLRAAQGLPHRAAAAPAGLPLLERGRGRRRGRRGARRVVRRREGGAPALPPRRRRRRRRADPAGDVPRRAAGHARRRGGARRAHGSRGGARAGPAPPAQVRRAAERARARDRQRARGLLQPAPALARAPAGGRREPRRRVARVEHAARFVHAARARDQGRGLRGRRLHDARAALRVEARRGAPRDDRAGGAHRPDARAPPLRAPHEPLPLRVVLHAAPVPRAHGAGLRRAAGRRRRELGAAGAPRDRPPHREPVPPEPPAHDGDGHARPRDRRDRRPAPGPRRGMRLELTPFRDSMFDSSLKVTRLARQGGMLTPR